MGWIIGIYLLIGLFLGLPLYAHPILSERPPAALSDSIMARFFGFILVVLVWPRLIFL
jgi:hypothetical protein